MKNFELKIAITLVVCISLTLLFSCQKTVKKQESIDKIGNEKLQSYYNGIEFSDRFQTNDASSRRGNPNQFYHTCGESWGDDLIGKPSKGLAAESKVTKFQVGGATMKSWWIAANARYTDAAGNKIRDWTQFGYFVDKQGEPIPAFYRYRWVNGSQRQAPPTIIYSGVNLPLNFGDVVRWEMKNIEGTTWWRFSRNDIEVFRADLGITEMTDNYEACTESWGSPSFSPAVMTNYLDVHRDGEWSHVPTGISNQYSWGVQGQLQRPEFIQSQFIMGGRTPLPNGTPWLWQPN